MIFVICLSVCLSDRPSVDPITCLLACPCPWKVVGCQRFGLPTFSQILFIKLRFCITIMGLPIESRMWFSYRGNWSLYRLRHIIMFWGGFNAAKRSNSAQARVSANQRLARSMHLVWIKHLGLVAFEINLDFKLQKKLLAILVLFGIYNIFKMNIKE